MTLFLALETPLLQARKAADSEIHAVLQQARAATSAVKDPYIRSFLLERLSVFWAEADFVQEAIRTVQAIPKLPEREYQPAPDPDQAFWKIIKVRADVGDIEGALKLYPYMHDAHPHSRDFALADIAVAMVKGGRTEDAFRLVSSIQDPTHRAFSLSMLAAAQAQVVNVSAAQETAATIQNENARDEALAAIAAAQSKRGELDGAMQTVKAIRRDQERNEALWEIALDQALAGEFKKALDVAAKMSNSWDKTNAILDIAELQAKAGDTSAAMVIVNGIQEPWERAIGITGIALVQAHLGRKQEAGESLNQAFRTARLEPFDEYRGRALIECAIVQATLGDVNGAIQTSNALSNMEEPHEAPQRLRSLEGVAAVQAKSGDVRGALKTKDLILINVKAAYPQNRYNQRWAEGAFTVSVLSKIAKVLAQDGNHKEGLKLAKTEKDSEVKAEVLLGIVEGMLTKRNGPAPPVKKNRFVFHM